MTKVLTIRMPVDLLSKAEAKAAQLGLDRAKYLRSLIEEDLRSGATKPAHRFASEDLIGSVPLGKGPYTNERVREQVRARALAQRERNR